MILANTLPTSIVFGSTQLRVFCSIPAHQCIYCIPQPYAPKQKTDKGKLKQTDKQKANITWLKATGGQSDLNSWF